MANNSLYLITSKMFSTVLLGNHGMQLLPHESFGRVIYVLSYMYFCTVLAKA